jgi:hypothetical protein
MTARQRLVQIHMNSLDGEELDGEEEVAARLPRLRRSTAGST